MVILENAFTAMSSLQSKFSILTASFKDKMEELNKARGETRQVREEMQRAREESKRIQEDQANELHKLKSENETLSREKILLSQQLFTAEETNTQLGLQVSRMHTEEFGDSMSNFSYICTFADALRLARRALPADQLKLFIEDLEKYLADNPPTQDRELPVADLLDLCDFSNLPEGVEIGDPVSDEENGDPEGNAKGDPIDQRHIGEQEEQDQGGKQGGQNGGEQEGQRAPTDGEQSARDGSEQGGPGRVSPLSSSLPVTPDGQFFS